MEVEASQLKDMGLHEKRAILDEQLGFSKWDRKRTSMTKSQLKLEHQTNLKLMSGFAMKKEPTTPMQLDVMSASTS